MAPADDREDDRDDDRDDDRPRRKSRVRDDDYEDDYHPRRRRRDDDDRGGDVGGLIPVNNGMALAAYYCGVFSFIPCLGAILGPLAVIFGFVGLSKANKHPKAKGKGHSIAGIICGGITTLGHIALAVIMAVSAASR